MPQYQETDSVVTIIPDNTISFYETAICRETLSKYFFARYFCKLLENSSNASKYVPQSFSELTKKTTHGKSYISKVATRSDYRMRFVKKVFLERCLQNSQKQARVRDSILINLHSQGCKKETLAQVFSCEFSKISRNTFFTEHLRAPASAFSFSEAATAGVL